MIKKLRNTTYKRCGFTDDHGFRCSNPVNTEKYCEVHLKMLNNPFISLSQQNIWESIKRTTTSST